MDFSLAWIYGTGNAMSLPISKYPSEIGYWDEIYYYGSRNQYRMRDYHRLDLNVNFKKEKSWGERTWSVGLYNAYNRKNPFFIDLKKDDEGKTKFVQYSLFPVIPSIRYSIKF